MQLWSEIILLHFTFSRAQRGCPSPRTLPSAGLGRPEVRVSFALGIESAAFVVTDLLLAGYEPLLCILDDLVILTSKIV